MVGLAEEPNCIVRDPNLGTVGSPSYLRTTSSSTTTTYCYGDSSTENSGSWNLGGSGEAGTSGANVGLNGGYNSGSESETYSSGYSTTTTEQTDCFGADVLNNSNND